MALIIFFRTAQILEKDYSLGALFFIRARAAQAREEGTGFVVQFHDLAALERGGRPAGRTWDAVRPAGFFFVFSGGSTHRFGGRC